MPQGLQGYYYGMPVATLTALLTAYTNCLTAIATAGQSYSIAGRQFTRADLDKVSQTIMEINAALARAAGTQTTQTYARFSDNSQSRFTSGVNGDLT